VTSPYEDLARSALAEVTDPANIGAWVEDRTQPDAAIVDVVFATTQPGYPGWSWIVSVAVLPETEPTVLELGQLPGEGALLAPEWIPWSVRLAEWQAAAAAEAERAEGAEDGEDVPDAADGDGEDDTEADDDLDEDDELDEDDVVDDLDDVDEDDLDDELDEDDLVDDDLDLDIEDPEDPEDPEELDETDGGPTE